MPIIAVELATDRLILRPLDRGDIDRYLGVIAERCRRGRTGEAQTERQLYRNSTFERLLNPYRTVEL